MITKEQHKEKYNQELRIFNTYEELDIVVILEGLLKFNDKMAGFLYNPFAGNYGQFIITDHTNQKCRKNKNVNQLESDKEFDPIPGHPTIKKPIRFWIFGTDDCSYSKTYKTKQDMAEDFDLLNSFEPINIYDLFDLGFCFY